MAEPTSSGTTPGLRAGSRFGHYRLIRLRGEGGFGQVWEAEDTVMDRVVAIKLLKPAYSGNQTFRQRLYREARTAGRLHEPHVVPIHGCGEIDGQLYIDMRLIDGTDLQGVLAREGPLGPARAVGIVRQIAAALDAAHADDLIHRDVKPANVLLSSDDFACLVDFGLANAASDAKLTSTGTTIGTFAYMAPERLNNAGVSFQLRCLRVGVCALRMPDRVPALCQRRSPWTDRRPPHRAHPASKPTAPTDPSRVRRRHRPRHGQEATGSLRQRW